MGYVRSFLPWLAVAVASSFLDWRYSSLIGVVLAVAMLLAARRSGRAWGALVIQCCAAVFFAALTVLAFVAPHSPLRDYTSALTSTALALTAWGSIVLRRPFTLAIARTQVSPEIAALAGFRRVSVVISTAWAIAFTAMAAALFPLLTVAPHNGLGVAAINVVAFTAAVVFTIRYPRYARARYARAATGTVTEGGAA